MSTIIFLIPVYCPSALFRDLLEELRKIDPSPIVLVDDGSGSSYSELFQRAAEVAGVVILRNAINLGKGAALKHGMNHVLVNYPDYIGVVTVDADGQHAVSDILKVANELRSGSAEVIFGTRDFGPDVPFRSKLGNVVSRHIYRFLIGIDLSDTQTGLRGIPRRLMELSLSIRSNRYEFETEQIIAAKTAGFKFRELPIPGERFGEMEELHLLPIRLERRYRVDIAVCAENRATVGKELSYRPVEFNSQPFAQLLVLKALFQLLVAQRQR